MDRRPPQTRCFVRMAFGTYRLSLDEQQQLSLEALHASRRQRIVSVRSQAQLFSTEQLKRYKASLAAEEVEKTRQRCAAMEARRDRNIAALLLQHGREIENTGRAQKDAQSAEEKERITQSEQQEREKVRTLEKQKRFHKALQRLHHRRAAERRLLMTLVEKRKWSAKVCRERANEYGASHLVEVTRLRDVDGEKNKRRSQMRWHCAAIDFRFSRSHQHLGIAETAQNHRHEERETAMSAAQRERARVLLLEQGAQKKSMLSADKARDRGEVALLRERAIVQKQMHEAHLEKIQRTETQRKQQEAIVKRIPFVHRVQNEVNSRETRESIGQMLADLAAAKTTPKEPQIVHTDYVRSEEKEGNCKPKVAHTDIGIQVNTEDATEIKEPASTASLQVPARDPGRPEKKTPREGTAREVPKKKKETACARPAHIRGTPKKTTSLEAHLHRVHPEVKPIATSHPDAHHPEKKPLRLAESAAPCAGKEYEFLQGQAQKEPNKTKSQPTTSECKACKGDPAKRKEDSKQHPAKGREEREAEDRAQDYEDALSDALSMDTDLFMQTYFPSSLSEPPATPASSDGIQLQDLSALLASSDTDGVSSETPSSTLLDPTLVYSNAQSTSPSRTESAPLRSPTLSISADTAPSHTESPFISETTGSAETDGKAPEPETFSGMRTLFKGLDQLSGDSLSLLSHVSTLLASQTQSDSLMPSDHTQEEESAESHSNASHCSSSFPDSLLLDTILEETDESQICISHMSGGDLSQKGDEMCEDLSFLDCLSLLYTDSEEGSQRMNGFD